MRKGYNELVGVQATFSRVTLRYNITMMYRWKVKGQLAQTGSMRGYDMVQHASVWYISKHLREVWAPAIKAIWRKTTPSSYIEYLQLKGGLTPDTAGLGPGWRLWAEW